MLEQVDLSLALSKAAFKQVMHMQIERLYDLSKLVYSTDVPVIIVFEGWDAAGKGTSIRRLTERLDPRGYKVLSTQAARTHEMQKPWLWRFWMQIPRRGQMAIFDRSWYGRVIVERVEGLIPIPDWIRAYEEINDFERTLADDGTVFVKFWLHISKEEQLRRFILLTQDKETAWQVAVEDWEHHQKYEEYQVAVEDMLANTSTPYAPWEIVPSTDQNYKNYTVFKTIISRLENALGVEPSEWLDLETLEAEAAKHKTVKKKRKAKKAARKAEKRRIKKEEAAAAAIIDDIAVADADEDTVLLEEVADLAALDGADTVTVEELETAALEQTQTEEVTSHA